MTGNFYGLKFKLFSGVFVMGWQREKARWSMTPTQQKVFRFICERLRDSNGVSPTYQEIADYMGHTSRSASFRLVGELDKMGLIKKPSKHHTGIFVPDLDIEYLPENKSC